MKTIADMDCKFLNCTNVKICILTLHHYRGIPFAQNDAGWRKAKAAGNKFNLFQTKHLEKRN